MLPDPEGPFRSRLIGRSLLAGCVDRGIRLKACRSQMPPNMCRRVLDHLELSSPPMAAALSMPSSRLGGRFAATRFEPKDPPSGLHLSLRLMWLSRALCQLMASDDR